MFFLRTSRGNYVRTEYSIVNDRFKGDGLYRDGSIFELYPINIGFDNMRHGDIAWFRYVQEAGKNGENGFYASKGGANKHNMISGNCDDHGKIESRCSYKIFLVDGDDNEGKYIHYGDRVQLFSSHSDNEGRCDHGGHYRICKGSIICVNNSKSNDCWWEDDPEDDLWKYHTVDSVFTMEKR